MNAENATGDPFAALMARRVKEIRVEGWPVFELREAPMVEVEPLIFNSIDPATGKPQIPPQEVLYQLIGCSIWIGDHRGSADMIKRMGPTAITKLVEAVQGEIFELYGIATEEPPAEDETAPGNGAAPPARRPKKKG